MKKTKKQLKLEKGQEKEQEKFTIAREQINYYSRQYRSTLITIHEDDASLISSEFLKGGFIFLNDELDQSRTSFFKFQVSRMYFRNYVYFGIANVWEFEKQFYYPYFKRKTHGGYLINNSGYSYSCLEKEKNNKQLSFTFQQQSIITMVVDYPQGIITWTCQNGKKSFSMKFNNKETLRPVIGLQQATVQIIQ